MADYEPQLPHRDLQLASDIGAHTEPTRRVGLVVLGMHRSGSSALTRMFSLLGCTLPLTLLPLSPDNPLGHFESQRVKDLNEEILGLAGTQWRDWMPVNPRMDETLIWPQLISQGRDIMRQEFAQAPLFVLKDPRICRLAGFWIEVLAAENIDAVFVLPIRNPIEVARSLLARDGIDESQGLLIWLRHVLAAEAATRGRPRVFTEYGALLDQWENIAARTANGLGLAWPRMSTLSGSEISQFLSPQLRHHVSKAADLEENGAVAPWLMTVCKIMLEWARGGENPADYVALDQVLGEFDVAGAAFARPMQNAELAIKRAALAELDSTAIAQERDRVAQRLVQVEGELDLVRGEHEARVAECGALAKERSALEQERDHLDGRLGEAEFQFASLREDSDARAMDRDRLVGEGDALAHERDALAGRLSQATREIAQIGDDRNARMAERDELAGLRTALVDERDDLACRLGEATAQCAAARDERDLLTAERDQLAGEGAVLAEDHHKVMRRLGEVEVKYVQVCNERNARIVERDQLARERATLVEERDKICRQLAEVGTELIAANAKNTKARVLGAGLEDDLTFAQAGNEALKHRLAVTESTLRQREEEIAQLSAERDSMRLDGAKHGALAVTARDDAERLAQECARLTDGMAIAHAGHVADFSRMATELSAARTAQQAAQDRVLSAEALAEGQASQLAERFAELAELARLLRHSEDGADHQSVEKSREVARLTATVRQQGVVAGQQKRHVEWLREIGAALSARRRWTALMPNVWQRRHDSRILKQRGLFDADAYRAAHPDVNKSGMNPLRHYLLHGHAEGRWPIGAQYFRDEAGQ